MRYSNFIN